MVIKVVDVEVNKAMTKTNKPYEFLEIQFKNMTFDGKAEAKKVMPFGAKEVFATLKDAKKGDVFTILREKNDGGFWEWVGIAQGEVEIESTNKGEAAVKPATTAAPKSNFETAEERAKRQVLIVRQSCLSNAIEFLNHNNKNYTHALVTDVANVFFDYVFQTPGNVATAAIPDLGEDEDIPY